MPPGVESFAAATWFQGCSTRVPRVSGLFMDGIRRVLLKEKTPNTWLYMGNVVISPVGNDREAVPYITAESVALRFST
jgi:hypothetical protein